MLQDRCGAGIQGSDPGMWSQVEEAWEPGEAPVPVHGARWRQCGAPELYPSTWGRVETG